MKEAALEVWRLVLRPRSDPTTERYLLRTVAAMIADAAADAPGLDNEERRAFAARKRTEIVEAVSVQEGESQRRKRLEERLEAAVDAMVGVPREP